MEDPNSFFIIFFITILATRVLLFLKPVSSPTVLNLRLHHYMYGILAILIGVIFKLLPIYALGFGLFIDELTYIILCGKTHSDNYSPKSIWGTFFSW